MNNQEAIDLLNQEEIPTVLNGKDNMHVVSAHIKAIEALEKQIAKKPIPKIFEDGYTGCPSCKNY